MKNENWPRMVVAALCPGVTKFLFAGIPAMMFLLSSPHLLTAQVSTRIDTLYSSGILSKSEYELLKANENRPNPIPKYDSLRTGGKISEAEYRMLKDKALKDLPPIVYPEAIRLRKIGRINTGFGTFSLIAGHVLFGVMTGNIIQQRNSPAGKIDVKIPILLGVSGAITTGLGIGLLSAGGQNRKDARMIEAGGRPADRSDKTEPLQENQSR